MKSNRHGGMPTAALRRTLRRDALATRPLFSTAFHERLVERVACEAALKSEVERPQPWASSPVAPRALGFAGGGLVAVVVASWAVFWMVGGHENSPVRGDVVAGGSRISAAAQLADERLVSFDTLPLYEDLDLGVRAGAWTLAESLVELPDWANLADFDAAALRSAAFRP